MRIGLLLLVGVLAVPSSRADVAAGLQTAKPPRLVTSRAKVVRTYSHDTSSFTQGLTFHQGWLYESTGGYGASRLRKIDLETGRVIAERRLDKGHFGEGLTSSGSRLVQLTWLERVGLVYDPQTLEVVKQFDYEFEGWGVARVGSNLVISDGGRAGRLRLMDATSFDRSGELSVTDEGRPVGGLNELELVEDELYANVWRTELVCRIDPKTGKVLGWIDLSGLLTTEERGRADVLNGIAYDRTKRRLVVTGKLWPRLFEVAIAPIESPPSPAQIKLSH